MGWMYLIISSFFEVGFASLLKASDGFRRLWPSVGFLVCVVGGFYFLEKSFAYIPMGTAYAVWVGIGTLGVTTIGVVRYKEKLAPMQMLLLTLLVISIIGLRLSERV